MKGTALRDLGSVQVEFLLQVKSSFHVLSRKMLVLHDGPDLLCPDSSCRDREILKLKSVFTVFLKVFLAQLVANFHKTGESV